MTLSTEEQRAKWRQKRKREYDRNGQSANDRYYVTRASAVRRGLAFSLTKQQFADIIAQPCVYGALTFPNPANEPRRGVDRKDSALGYVLDNCVPCCERHNRAKNDTFTYDEWLTICADYNVQCGAARQGRKKMPRTYAPALPRRQAGLAGWLNRQPSQPASQNP